VLSKRGNTLRDLFDLRCFSRRCPGSRLGILFFFRTGRSVRLKLLLFQFDLLFDFLAIVLCQLPLDGNDVRIDLMKLLLFLCNVFLSLLCAVLNQVFEIGLAMLILRLDVTEDDFIERRTELAIRDICADSLQVFLRQILDLFRQMQRDQRIEELAVRLPLVPVKRALKMPGAATLEKLVFVQEREQFF
jgi:hypothetical protein